MNMFIYNSSFFIHKKKLQAPKSPQKLYNLVYDTSLKL